MIINYSTSLKALLHDLVGVGRLRPLLNGVERLCPLCLRSLKALLQAFKLKTLLQMSKLKALHRVTF